MQKADQVEIFNSFRPLLFSIAYRMLGSVMDAEDIVQESFIRWHGLEKEEVQSPKAYLTTIVTRLCIDHLRLARTQREVYVGYWLPEPLLTEETPDFTGNIEVEESLSTAFLILLETLGPVERAVFLLRDVFDYDYSEIAPIVEKSEANCRQMVRRARHRLAEHQPRFKVSPQQRERMTLQFVQACSTGDMNGLLNLLSEDITIYSDGGGKVTAARNPVHGSSNVARFLLGIFSKAPPEASLRVTTINGGPGLIAYLYKKPFNVISFNYNKDRIEAIYVVLNPDKLRRIT